MNHFAPLKRPAATIVGLAIALFASPVFIATYRRITGENHSDWQVVGRELGIFLLVGVLLWIVRTQEALPLTSIGWRAQKLRRSLLRGLALTVIVLAVTVCLYLLLQRLGIHLGEERSKIFHPSLLAVTLIMLRAGTLSTGPGRYRCSIRSGWSLHPLLFEVPRSLGQHHRAFPRGFRA